MGKTEVTQFLREAKMLLEEAEIISKIQKFLKESYQSIGDNMISGSVDNMEKYKYKDGTGTCLFKNITGNL